MPVKNRGGDRAGKSFGSWIWKRRQNPSHLGNVSEINNRDDRVVKTTSTYLTEPLLAENEQILWRNLINGEERKLKPKTNKMLLKRQTSSICLSMRHETFPLLKSNTKLEDGVMDAFILFFNSILHTAIQELKHKGLLILPYSSFYSYFKRNVTYIKIANGYPESCNFEYDPLLNLFFFLTGKPNTK